MESQQPDTQKKMGRGMWIIAWLCAMYLLYQFFDSKLEQQWNPNQSVSSTEQGGRIVTVLERNRYGHYVTNGYINGQPVTFMVDTGATSVSVPAHIADMLGLPRGPAGYAQTANGTVQVFSSQIEKLQIGDVELTNVGASINPGMEQNEILLGMSALKRLEFTQRGNELILKTY